MTRPNYHATVHWKTDENLPLWQLKDHGSDHYHISVDITEMFDARFKLTADRGVSADDYRNIRTLIEDGLIESAGHSNSYYGYTPEIFDHTDKPGDGWGWHVTNSCVMSPGLQRSGHRNKILGGIDDRHLTDFAAKHPEGGYTVQFHNVPWSFFKRYWRKPINLNRPYHGSKLKSSFSKNYGYVTGRPSIHSLYVHPFVLREYKTLFMDFRLLHDDRKLPEVNQWMLNNARKFYPMSDGDSPFVKSMSEFLFSADFNKITNLP